MTRKQVRRRLRKLGVSDFEVDVWGDQLATFHFTATVEDGEESNVLVAEVVRLLNEYHKSRGGHGLRLAGPVERHPTGGRS